MKLENMYCQQTVAAGRDRLGQAVVMTSSVPAAEPQAPHLSYSTKSADY